MHLFLVLSVGILSFVQGSRLNLHTLMRTSSKSLAAVFLSTAMLAVPTNPAHAATSESAYISSIASVIEAREVLAPVLPYVKNQAYDNARTNIKYCLNQLRLQKQLDTLVQNSIDFSEDADAIDAAQEASTRITNTATQLDSTIYTLIFIPSDDGLPPPSAEKYIKQSADEFADLNRDLDVMLKLPTAAQMQEAQSLAAKELKAAPAFLFKQVTKKTMI